MQKFANMEFTPNMQKIANLEFTPEMQEIANLEFIRNTIENICSAFNPL
jgi:hypothetical protein